MVKNILLSKSNGLSKNTVNFLAGSMRNLFNLPKYNRQKIIFSYILRYVQDQFWI